MLVVNFVRHHSQLPGLGGQRGSQGDDWSRFSRHLSTLHLLANHGACGEIAFAVDEVAADLLRSTRAPSNQQSADVRVPAEGHPARGRARGLAAVAGARRHHAGAARLHYPLCVGGARACPPEDSGGPHGYENLLEQLADPKHEEHDSSVTWVGGHFDPAGFDVNMTNRALRDLK